ncbi:hypothetical protein GCM10027429_22190 [Marivirga atlantica]|jgi:CubicO group peptidase (beta-lactamase class C family)|uniref:Beta-lactamase family protein n=1 Tax=Marivirga atlantica TaxID=1548457 RepID=A0A937ABF3_9BACT|nr:serine hydrolase domain-containing protein [Marivirga atlantica]MBL0765836.1 beta-lactamase family protein [Marivirga atlantica]
MKTALTIIALLLLTNTVAQAQGTKERIDSIVNSFYKANPEVSISVGFFQDGEEFYTSYGNLSRDVSEAVNKHTLFEIASITKIMTSNLIAQAVLEGKLELDEYIDKYLPTIYKLNKNLRHKISISDLASHQSGLPDVDFVELIEKDPQQPTKIVDQQMLTSMINNCNSLKDYGTYRYSTVGYTLLGQILEQIYGVSYEVLLNKLIFQPLAMESSFTSEFDVVNTAQGYNGEGGKQELFLWNVLGPSGLVKSSTSDMLNYLRAILDENSIIGKAAKLTEVPYYSEENEAVGLGTNIYFEADQTIYLKSGDSMGQSSMLCYNREANWGILFFINQNNSKMRNEMLNTIFEHVLK